MVVGICESVEANVTWDCTSRVSRSGGHCIRIGEKHGASSAIASREGQRGGMELSRSAAKSG